ncbi:MAG: NADH-quinone oxidoreductase subunit K [Marinilabiliaceae bacterium]
MELIIVIFIGILYACAVYLLLRRSIVKVILGIFVMGNATNLIIFLSGKVMRGGTGFVPEGAKEAAIEAMSDPLPQGLVLKAIIINLGIAAYILALKYKYFERTGTHDLDQLSNTEQK